MSLKTLFVIKLLTNKHCQITFIGVIITDFKRFEDFVKAVSTSQAITEESQDISSSVTTVLMMTSFFFCFQHHFSQHLQK